LHNFNMQSLPFLLLAICIMLPCVQGQCQPGCNCGIPGCTCGEKGGQCPLPSGPSGQENPSNGEISISYTSEPLSSEETPYILPTKPSSTHLNSHTVNTPLLGVLFPDTYLSTPLSPSYSTPQAGSFSEGPSSQQGLETENGEKINPGDTLKLYPPDKIELGAKCREFVLLVRGSMGGGINLQEAIKELAYLRLKGQVTGDYGDLSMAFAQTVLDLTNCAVKCAKLYEENPTLITQSSSHSPILLGSLREQSGSPAQIELGLESGPFLAEVVNDKVSLSIATATTTVSSVGNNTFGVVYDPINSTSFVVAYKQPVDIQPKNNSLSPFTLSSGQAVIVNAKYVSPIVSLTAISSNVPSPAGGSSSTPSNRSSIEPIDSLQKLKQLRDMLTSGLITQEDYDAKKKEILSRI